MDRRIIERQRECLILGEVVPKRVVVIVGFFFFLKQEVGKLKAKQGDTLPLKKQARKKKGTWIRKRSKPVLLCLKSCKTNLDL